KPRRQAVQAAAHFSAGANAGLAPCAGSKHLPGPSDEGARVRLFSHVGRGARAELTHALQQVFLPREKNDRRVAQRDVATEGATEREAVEAGHEDVAHDEVRRMTKRQVERGETVESLMHLTTRGAKQVG